MNPTPTPMPEASEGTVTGGLWFAFPLDDHVVRAWGSSLTGMERVYVDENMVSEGRSVGRTSAYDFSIDGLPHQIAFKVISVMTATVECALFRDGTLLKTLRSRYVKSTSRFRLVLPLVVGAAWGAVMSLTKWPLWTVVFPVAGALVRHFRGRSAGQYVIEEASSST